MANLITTEVISGGAVYGVNQVTYKVDGAAGQDFSAALTAASFRESTAIENAASAYVEVVRQRQRKMDDVGVLLAVLSKAIANKDPKNNNKDDPCYTGTDLYDAVQNCRKYGINVNVSTFGNSATITFGNAYKAQASVKFELDKESNDLQQDSVSLRSYVSKRDNAFSAAARLVKKANDTASSNISNIGR